MSTEKAALEALSQDCDNIIAAYKGSYPQSAYLHFAQQTKEHNYYARSYTPDCPNMALLKSSIEQIKKCNYVANPEISARLDEKEHGPSDNFCFPLFRIALQEVGTAAAPK